MVVTALLSLGVMYIAPTGLGPHLALPLFAAVYAWERQTVFWRYTAPILAAYAVLVPLWLGGSIELLPWAIAALVAGLLGRLFSSGPSLGEVGDTTAPVADPSPLGLASEGERRVAEGDAPPAAEEAQSAAPSGPSLGLLDEPPSPSPSSPKKPNPPPGLLDW
jgi:hypothetical protein